MQRETPVPRIQPAQGWEGSQGAGSRPLVVVSGAKARRWGYRGSKDLLIAGPARHGAGQGRGAGTPLVVGAGWRESPLPVWDATGEAELLPCQGERRAAPWWGPSARGADIRAQLAV